MESLSAQEFIKSSSQGILVDVRSPAEYKNGHIPQAVSLPIFSDDERANIGTLFKQESKQTAFLKGLDIVGPKLRKFVEIGYSISRGKPLFIYCWRGGMRSASMATLLHSAGIKCYLLKGGYKAYRNFILSELSLPKNYVVLGGKTGSGKTAILLELKKQNQQVLDLEAIAHHKGSAFGKIGELPQPSNEQFGNEIHAQLSTFNPDYPIWLEDESRSIGQVMIPKEFYEVYRKAPLFVLEIPFEERLNHLTNVYGNSPVFEIKSAFVKITKKIGGQNLKNALEFIDSGLIKEAAAIALNYYDKTYTYGLEHKNTGDISFHPFEKFNLKYISAYLLEKADERNHKVNTF